ncbi:recombination and repair protein RecT [Desulfosporosinus acididurans]|uniref:Recombination and repair protein RecT n=1 Tax=Desulfosporosinus acididurans TaxID=476652 RepID=A0A0J1FKP7_9FIRM|nr:RecT family recombinase [Desulfosporosinus acididurans]KLU64045.1 recombination and repair protein RecT [Desulfosporosinus acididurans]
MANDLMAVKEETLTTVETKIKEMQENGGINLPANYSASNALQSAWLILQETKDKDGKAALEVCTRSSIANAMLDTVIQGLSPAKKQVYYIVRGSKLTAMRSYFGTMAVTKRLESVESIFAQVVYEGDEFEFEINGGTKRITKHKQTLASMDSSKIVAAYCTIFHDGGQEFTEIITKKQIDMAWAKTSMKVNNVQKEFPEDMAKRTVINKTCKMYANTSDDSNLLVGSFNNTAEDFDKEQEAAEEIKANANGDVIDIQAEEPSKPNDNQVIEQKNDTVQQQTLGPDF